ncbi:MAG: hypothetical protein QM778_03720 [Myxococcales bacterium]
MRTQLALVILLVGCSSEHAEEPTSELASARPASPPSEDASDANSPALPARTDAASDAQAPDDSFSADAQVPSDASLVATSEASHEKDDTGQDAGRDLAAAAGRVGAGCTSDEDCADLGAGHRCLTEGDLGSPHGYCTRDCDPLHATQCGAGAACVTYNEETQCQRLCASDSDCRAEDGYVCAPFLVFGLCLHPESP